MIRELSDTENWVNIAIDGPLDAMGMHQIQQSLEEYVQGSKSVLVDMQGVDFVASLGMGMLITSAQRMQQSGNKLILIGVQPQVLSAFRAVGVDRAIDMVDSLVEAESRLDS